MCNVESGPPHTGQRAAEAAKPHGIQLEVVKHSEAKHGFVHRQHAYSLTELFRVLALKSLDRSFSLAAGDSKTNSSDTEDCQRRWFWHGGGNWLAVDEIVHHN